MAGILICFLYILALMANLYVLYAIGITLHQFIIMVVCSVILNMLSFLVKISTGGQV